jgi:fermentation-respiration switch protein FrsA (DUF1100 family)
MPQTLAPKSMARLLRRGLKLIAISLVGFYIVLVVVLYFIQDALIFPGRTSQGRPESQVRLGSGCELIELKTPKGLRVSAIFGTALSPDGTLLPDAKNQPTILYFYGNGEYLGACMDKLYVIRKRGLNVMIPDYLGYGLSEGKAGEAGCIAAADAAYEHLILRQDINTKKILFGGFSMGGAVAIDLAARKPSVGVIVSCTFTSLSDMAWRQYPYVPIPLLLRHRFATKEKIAKIHAPILIARGEIDPIIPAYMSDALAAAAKAPVTRIVMKGEDHSDLMRIAQIDPEVSVAVNRFLDGVR